MNKKKEIKKNSMVMVVVGKLNIFVNQVYGNT